MIFRSSALLVYLLSGVRRLRASLWPLFTRCVPAVRAAKTVYSAEPQTSTRLYSNTSTLLQPLHLHSMPFTQLMRKLAGRESPRQGQAGPGLATDTVNHEAAAMDHDCCQHLTVTAEIVPMQDGRRSPCSPSSSTSSDGVSEQLRTGPFGRMASAPVDSSAPLNLMVGSLPSSLSAVSSQPAAARALRAKGKAALRSSTLERDEPLPSPAFSEPFSPRGPLQQQARFHDMDRLDSGASSSSSMEAQLSHMSTSPDSHSYQRAATAPLPSWTAALTVNTNTEAGSTTAPSALSPNPPQPSTVAAALAADVEDDVGSPLCSPLVSPGSTGAAAGDDAFWCEECELHCDWEDGVVASWFKDQDHSELLDMLHTEEELETAADEPVCNTSSMSLQAVYSSSLYA